MGVTSNFFHPYEEPTLKQHIFFLSYLFFTQRPKRYCDSFRCGPLEAEHHKKYQNCFVTPPPPLQGTRAPPCFLYWTKLLFTVRAVNSATYGDRVFSFPAPIYGTVSRIVLKIQPPFML